MLLTPHKRFVFAASVTVALLAGCGKGSTVVPDPGAKTGRASSAAVTAGHSFSEAAGKQLTVADLETYIDPSITGRDRQLARHFLALIPKEKRGDFIYYDTPTHIVSNRRFLIESAKFIAPPSAGSSIASGKTTPIYSDAVRHASDSSYACAPPKNTTSGEYIRQFSRCGFTGAIGYVTVPCGYSNFDAGDGGTLYFSIGGASGSLQEGGVQYNMDYSVQPYERSSINGYETGHYTNATQHWQCGQTLGIMHGIVPNSSYVFTGIGTPTQSPSSAYLKPTVTWNYAAWAFFNRNNDDAGTGFDPNNMPTPCVNCYIYRATTIAQNFGTNFSHRSWFGVGNGYLYIHWEQVEIGQLVQPCAVGTTSAECTIRFNTNPSTWLNGYDFYPSSTVSNSVDAAGQNRDPYEVYEGIDLRQYNGAVQAMASGGFTDPRPPAQNVTIYRVDCSMIGQVVMYYPGDTDYDGNVVPDGETETYRFRGSVTVCNAN